MEDHMTLANALRQKTATHDGYTITSRRTDGGVEYTIHHDHGRIHLAGRPGGGWVFARYIDRQAQWHSPTGSGGYAYARQTDHLLVRTYTDAQMERDVRRRAGLAQHHAQVDAMLDATVDAMIEGTDPTP